MSDLPKRRDTLDFIDYMKSARSSTRPSPQGRVQDARRFLRQDRRHEPSHLFPGRDGEMECCQFAKPRGSGHQGRRHGRLPHARAQLKQGRSTPAVRGSETRLSDGFSRRTPTPSWASPSPWLSGHGFARRTRNCATPICSAEALMESGEYRRFSPNTARGHLLDGIYGSTAKR
ncbi:hypothetical protein F2981_19740 (plasmid) [Sinorhizobium meliloti]|nr:hypothetical protein [Sinorhizobium meliloti]